MAEDRLAIKKINAEFVAMVNKHDSRVKIPSNILEELGIKPGDRLHIRLESIIETNLQPHSG